MIFLGLFGGTFLTASHFLAWFSFREVPHAPAPRAAFPTFILRTQCLPVSMYKKGKTKAFPFFVVGTIGLRRNPVGAPSAGCSARPCARAVLPTLHLMGGRLTCVSAQKKEGKSLPFLWWGQQGSNLWPHACEACALTNWAMPPCVTVLFYSLRGVFVNRFLHGGKKYSEKFSASFHFTWKKHNSYDIIYLFWCNSGR